MDDRCNFDNDNDVDPSKQFVELELCVLQSGFLSGSVEVSGLLTTILSSQVIW